jgi:hypothetical protein
MGGVAMDAPSRGLTVGRHPLKLSPATCGGRPLEAGLHFVCFRTRDLSQTRRLVLVP